MSGFLEFLLVKPNLLCFAAECLLIIFCFHPLNNRAGAGWKIGAGLSLALIFYLYMTSGSGGSGLLFFVGRALLHTALIFLFLLFLKEIPLSACALFALLYISGYQFSIGVRLFVSAISMSVSGMVSNLITSLSVIAVQFVWACIIRRIVLSESFKHISIFRWGVTIILTLLQIYIRSSMMPNMGRTLELPIWFQRVEYPLIAMVGLLLVQAFYELSIFMQARANRAVTEKLLLEYELKNTRQQTRSAEDVRRIYHDIKNHLLAISNMSSSSQVQTYARDLMSQFNDYENTFNTGNDVVDSLLGEKMMLARLEKINFNVCMDLHELNFMSPVDIVSIFGNAIDNAMEALVKLPEDSRNFFLRSINSPGFITLVFSNPCAAVLRDDSGNIVTTKDDLEKHGIGLKSIRHTVERCGGVIQTQMDEQKKRFDLTVLLPISN